MSFRSNHTAMQMVLSGRTTLYPLNQSGNRKQNFKRILHICRWNHFLSDLRNQFKLNTKNQTISPLKRSRLVGSTNPPPGWVFGVQLGLLLTLALVETDKKNVKKNVFSLIFICVLILIRAWICRKPTWTPKRNQTAISQKLVGFVFGVQLDYSCRKK